MKIRAIRAEQATTRLYVGVLPAGELIPVTKVDVRTPANPTGYQRELATRRISEVKHYLEAADGVFPSSVLLSYRSGDFQFNPTDGDDAGQLGELVLRDPNETLYVIDGQHRIEALRQAIEDEPDRFNAYPVPFTLLANPDVFEEARWFYLVNSKAKRVPIELAEGSWPPLRTPRVTTGCATQRRPQGRPAVTRSSPRRARPPFRRAGEDLPGMEGPHHQSRGEGHKQGGRQGAHDDHVVRARRRTQRPDHPDCPREQP